ncbi:MAG TPA: hypothetical protein DCP08_10280, partial [Chloroflexi bacterium]|nr:hypothetical protein [Chloroflexota bacterium]
QAVPINEAELTSPWITGRPRALTAARRTIGESAYQAREGANPGGAIGVYWVRVLERRADGLLVVENLAELGKRKVPKVQAAIEPDLVYPLLRWADARRWVASPSAYIIMAQDPVRRAGYEERWMKQCLPHTYGYLRQFKGSLQQRRLYQTYYDKTAPFYSMYNIGPYTLASHKVLWRRMGTRITAAVASAAADSFVGEKPPIPQETITFVPLPEEAPAHFICALMNSTVVNLVAKSYSVGKSFGSAHLMGYINVPQYDLYNPLHCQLSALSQRAHELAAKGQKEALKEVEEQIDRKAAELWGITKADLKEIKRSLEELG